MAAAGPRSVVQDVQVAHRLDLDAGDRVSAVIVAALRPILSPMPGRIPLARRAKALPPEDDKHRRQEREAGRLTNLAKAPLHRQTTATLESHDRAR